MDLEEIKKHIDEVSQIHGPTWIKPKIIDYPPAFLSGLGKTSEKQKEMMDKLLAGMKLNIGNEFLSKSSFAVFRRKMRCVDSWGLRYLTRGNIYEVMSTSDDTLFSVVCDDGIKREVFQDRFRENAGLIMPMWDISTSWVATSAMWKVE